MELSFNELEQQMLRFLKWEFLEKGSKPETMLAPATMHSDVMAKFDLALAQYREVMSRLEHQGIVRVLALGAKNGHLQIDPIVVELVRQLDDRVELVKAEEKQKNRMEQAKQFFFAKWWFVVLLIALFLLTVVATVVSNLKTILDWLGVRQ